MDYRTIITKAIELGSKQAFPSDLYDEARILRSALCVYDTALFNAYYDRHSKDENEMNRHLGDCKLRAQFLLEDMELSNIFRWSEIQDAKAAIEQEMSAIIPAEVA